MERRVLKIITQHSLLVFVPLLLVACSNTQKKVTYPTFPEEYQEQGIIERDHVDRALIESAKKIQHSLRILAEIKNAELLENKSHEDLAFMEWQSKTIPEGMGVPISIDNWTGPGVEVLEMIGAMTGYNVFPFGFTNANQLNVVVSSVNRPAVDVLRDVATQMNGVAKVKVIPASKRIEVHYHAAN